jgi:hypothetical protein
MSEQTGLKPHDIASAHVESWRGRCLDFFARAERAVGQTLEAAVTAGKPVKLRHLGGQRLVDLTGFAETCGGTAKQVAALRLSLQSWQRVEARRSFLAHGVATTLLDKNAQWFVTLDFTAYRSNTPVPDRWTLSGPEAAEFERRLSEAFVGLTRELGQLKKRLTP